VTSFAGDYQGPSACIAVLIGAAYGLALAWGAGL